MAKKKKDNFTENERLSVIVAVQRTTLCHAQLESVQAKMIVLQGQYQALQAAMKAATDKEIETKAGLWKKYGMEKDDSIDFDTGAITFAKAPKDE